MEEKTLKSYEIAYLLRSEDSAEGLTNHLKRLEAEILYQSEIRSLKLTYPITHLPAAYFGHTHFKLQPDLISGLRDALKLDNQIIRFLIVTPPFTKEKSSVPGVPSTPRRAAAPPKSTEARPSEEAVVSNDLLEEKLEEILK